ncbi:sensor histidine kinase [Parvularcula maris]|uniref:Tetratricopeptide repeat protein n=1 Tax=Parvularcula maris TaxID=2965077 RepID=A0A9X2L931_9PROT|nr:tetratricopeptide repeat protein [Parvularcula maris]MCQ8185169.1 tetratricopeptide repeat protein [Parvularcula maris]
MTFSTLFRTARDARRYCCVLAGFLIPLPVAALAQAPSSCPGAVAMERVPKEELPRVQEICIDYIATAAPEEQFRVIGSFLVNENDNRARYVKAKDLDPLLPEMNQATLVRANAYRAKEYANPELGLTAEDLQRFIREAEEADDPVALSSLYYSATIQQANSDNRLDLMEEYLSSGLAIIRENGFSHGLEYIYLNGLGNVALDNGEFVDAVNYYSDILDLAQTTDPLRGIAANINIARVFTLLGGYEQALAYLETAMELLKDPDGEGNDNFLINALYEIGDTHYSLGNYEEADAALTEAMKVVERNAGTPFGQRLSVYTQRILTRQAKTAYALGDPERAIELATEASGIENQQQSAYVKAEVMSWLARLHIDQGHTEQAEEAAGIAEAVMLTSDRGMDDLVEMKDERRLVFQYARNMASVLPEVGRLEDALAYASLTAELAERLTEEENLSAISNAATLLEIREGQRQVASLSLENQSKETALRRARMSYGLTLALAVITGLAALFVYRFYRTERALAHTRALYVRDTHHRAKNNLQIIFSLLSMTERRRRQEGLEAAELRGIRDQAAAMAMLHEQVQTLAPEEAAAIRTDDYFTNLMAILGKTYHAGERLEVSGIDSFVIDTNLATPLGLIMTEIVSNSLKHNAEAGVKVVLTDRAEGLDRGWGLVEVSDDGSGFDPDRVDLSNAVGLTLVRDLAKQIGGSLKVKSGPSGTTWRMTFPLRSAHSA